jgi:SAM-dependent methyltransferase
MSVSKVQKRNDIHFLSKPAPVKMGTEWFDIVDRDHFWIRARYRVLSKLSKSLDQNLRIAEIGCGSGLLQYQLEKYHGLSVDGYDLDLDALQKNISAYSRISIYNIFEKNPSLNSTYDVLFLFDVLEHLDDDKGFLESSIFHLKPGGLIYINVPSREELRSKYDTLVGHVRRYKLSCLVSLAESCALEVIRKTYWGLPFYPILLLRKQLMNSTPDEKVLKSGMKPPGKFANSILFLLSCLEPIPQTLLGTSAMVVARKNRTNDR